MMNTSPAKWVLLQRLTLTLFTTVLVSSCGGGGSNSSLSPAQYSPGWEKGQFANSAAWEKGQFTSSEVYASQCLSPAMGESKGSATDEKMWLRSWTNEYYLWYDEVEDINPSGYGVQEYFDLLKTNALTASGKPKDQFHFYATTEEWESSQSGVVSGYGANWVFGLHENNYPEITVAYVEPGSAADLAKLTRGDQIVSVDGFPMTTILATEMGVDILDEALQPTVHSAEHSFVIKSLDQTTRTVTLTSGAVVTSPVFDSKIINTETGVVGYLVFNAHNLVAQDALITVFDRFIEANVSDLVLDLRYNGGGLLAVASQLAYMIAGNSQTEDQVFEKLVFSDKHQSVNPFSGDTLTPLPFLSSTFSTLGTNHPDGTLLPSLNLSRVFVLTSNDTCSASESIINSLLGVDVDVIQIGTTTCGKPYGFYATDNCGYTYFSVNFKGANNKGFGDYSDGFSPQNTINDAGVLLEGCYTEDDLTKPLGDTSEGMLAQALAYRESGTCPVRPANNVKTGLQKPGPGGLEQFNQTKNPLYSNKIMLWL